MGARRRHHAHQPERHPGTRSGRAALGRHGTRRTTIDRRAAAQSGHVISGRSIVMREYGGPSVLRLEDTPVSAPGPGEVRIRARASAINHSDLEIRAGNWPIRRDPPFPYTPGIEVVGEVDAVARDATGVTVGDRVITMMQGLGGVRGERPGGYAEYVTVAAGAIAHVPDGVSDEMMAALGLAAVTAYAGLRNIGALAAPPIL